MSVRRARLFLTVAGAALVLAVGGCGADSNDAPSSSRADSGALTGGGAPAQEGAAPGAGPAQEPNKVPDNLDVENRSIIYAGTMTVRVDDVDAAAAKAIAAATAAGGFVGGDNRRRDDRRSQGTLILRIPAAKFTPTLEQLKELGDEEDRTITAQDVTDQVVDVEARLNNAEASVDRIRALLAKATTIGEITSLESELSRRLSDLESLQARKRKLDGLTALSTITLQLLGPEAVITRDKEEVGLAAGFKDGWSAFVASLQVALTVFGWLLPWLLLVGVPVYALVWLYRRFRPKRPVAPAPGPLPGWVPPHPPAPVGVRPAPGPFPGPIVPAGAARGPVRSATTVSGPPVAGQPVSGPPAGPGRVPPVTGPVSGPPAPGAAAPLPGTESAPPATNPVSAPPAGRAVDGGGVADGGGAGPVSEPPAGGRGPGSPRDDDPEQP